MKLWNILVGLPFSELSFVSLAVSNAQYGFTKKGLHLVNITLQCKWHELLNQAFTSFYSTR